MQLQLRQQGGKMISATPDSAIDTELSDSQPGFLRLLAIFLLVGLAVSCLAYLMLDRAIESQRNNNALLTTEIARLDGQIKEIAGLELDIQALDTRRSVVESLQEQRNIPVRMVSALVQSTPDAVALTKLTQVENVLTIQGVAASNAEVAQYLANLEAMPTRFARSELLETLLGDATVARLPHMLSFSIRTDIVGAAGKLHLPSTGGTDGRPQGPKL